MAWIDVQNYDAGNCAGSEPNVRVRPLHPRHFRICAGSLLASLNPCSVIGVFPCGLHGKTAKPNRSTYASAARSIGDFSVIARRYRARQACSFAQGDVHLGAWNPHGPAQLQVPEATLADPGADRMRGNA